MAFGTLILGDQLFPFHGRLEASQPIFMREDDELASRFPYHQQKLVLFFSAMRHYADELRSAGFSVTYHRMGEYPGRFLDALQRWMTDQNLAELRIYEPSDRFFGEVLRGSIPDSQVALTEIPNPGFITNRNDWMSFRGRKRLLMADFYRILRQKSGLLMDSDGEPIGNRWSFDAENRKAIPKGIASPHFATTHHDAITREVISMVSELFTRNPGDAREFKYAVNRSGALSALDHFVDQRLPGFGPYEDAMRVHEPFLWHSVLSPYLNLGILTPMDVLGRVTESYNQGLVPLASAEGFVRQVLGWREFIKGMDFEYSLRGFGPGKWPKTFSQQRSLKSSWYDGSTGLFPLDTVIRRTLKHGYCHHIERLMILGASMLMSEVDAEEAYAWFMEMFVDSADWVMAPNVMGMSLYSDGGLFATKPYFSGSAYLRKMGDWPSGEWTDVWDGLYWRFIQMNREFFSRNPRMAAVASGIDRLDPLRRDRIFAAAEGFIAENTNPLLPD